MGQKYAELTADITLNIPVDTMKTFDNFLVGAAKGLQNLVRKSPAMKELATATKEIAKGLKKTKTAAKEVAKAFNGSKFEESLRTLRLTLRELKNTGQSGSKAYRDLNIEFKASQRELRTLKKIAKATGESVDQARTRLKRQLGARAYKEDIKGIKGLDKSTSSLNNTLGNSETKAKRTAKAFGNSIINAVSQFRVVLGLAQFAWDAFIKSFVLPIGATAGIFFLVDRINGATSDIARMAGQVGLANDELRAFGLFAEKAGFNIETVADAAEELNNKIGNLKKGIEEITAREGLQNLGLQFEDVKDLDTSGQLRKVFAAAQKEIRKGNFQGAVSGIDQLISGQGNRLAGALRDLGDQDIEALLDQLKGLNFLTEQSVRISKAWKDAFVDIKSVFRTSIGEFAAQFSKQLIPGLMITRQLLIDNKKAIQEGIGKAAQVAGDWMFRLLNLATTLVIWFRDNKTSMMAFSESLFQLAKLFGLILKGVIDLVLFLGRLISVAIKPLIFLLNKFGIIMKPLLGLLGMFLGLVLSVTAAVFAWNAVSSAAGIVLTSLTTVMRVASANMVLFGKAVATATLKEKILAITTIKTGTILGKFSIGLKRFFGLIVSGSGRALIAIRAMTVSLWSMAAAFAATPVGMIVIGLAAIVALGFAIKKGIDSISSKYSNIGKALKVWFSLMNPIFALILNWEFVMERISRQLELWGILFSEAIKPIQELFSEVERLFGELSSAFDELLVEVDKLIAELDEITDGKFSEFLDQLFDMESAFRTVGKVLAFILKVLLKFTPIITILKTIIFLVKGITGGIQAITTAFSFLKGLIVDPILAAKDAVTGLFETIDQKIESIKRKARELLPALTVGLGGPLGSLLGSQLRPTTVADIAPNSSSNTTNNSTDNSVASTIFNIAAEGIDGVVDTIAEQIRSKKLY